MGGLPRRGPVDAAMWGLRQPCGAEGFSSQQLLLLQGIDCRLTGSVVVVHILGCSEACGIFLDQELNPCPLRWQEGSQPLDHQGSPRVLRFCSEDLGFQKASWVWNPLLLLPSYWATWMTDLTSLCFNF